jgi:hypothetical protein
MMERPRPQHKVSLEDILRLKRAERPDPEFWAEFEDQLRRKQLAAIVDKRPWWRRLSTASVARLSLPLGATAIVAFTLVTFRDRSQPATNAGGAIAASAISSAPTLAVNPLPGTSTVSSRDIAASSEKNSPAVAQLASDSSQTASAPSSNRSMVDGINAIAAREEASEPSLAQVILGIEGAMESDARPQYHTESLLTSVNMLDGARAQSVSSVETGSLSQMSAPRDDRRARLLASVHSDDQGDMVSANPRVARSRERIASRLTEQSLYDSISRLGLNGDSVSIKF